MLPSICRQACRMGLLRAQIFSRTTAATALRAAPKSRVLELASQLSRRASTVPTKAYKPKKQPPLLSKIIIYHIGQPRVYMIGGLKLTAILIFGFFVAVVLPTHLENKAAWWQAPLVVVGATVPVLAIWFLTYPMVIWMHVRVPKSAQQNKILLDQFLAKPTGDMDVYITTMSPIGKPRVTNVKLADLKPVKKRLGLVNYVRDVTQENKERKWYQYRAIGNFLIPNQDQTSPKVQKGLKRTPWIWFSLIEAFQKRHGSSR